MIDTSSSYANAYLSLDGGKTNAGPGTVGEQGSDLADYGSDVSGDAFGYTTAGAPSPVSAADLKLMTALGWTLTSAAPPTTSTPPATADASVPPLHANDLNYSLSASGPNHFIDNFNFEASFPDLIHAFGTNQSAMDTWYKTFEPQENRVETFNGLDYVASHTDLIDAFKDAGSEKAVQDAGAQHFITYGLAEGRSTTLNGLDYIAAYGDLIKAFGADNDAGAFHFIEAGHSEGRAASFDGLDYIASSADLINAFGANEQAGAAHFIHFGFNEGRSTSFDGLAYIANYTDLMTALGANNDAGATHYIQFGHNEGRTTSFNVAAYEAAHPDLHGVYATDDQFLAAYIDHYHHTGNLLT